MIDVRNPEMHRDGSDFEGERDEEKGEAEEKVGLIERTVFDQGGNLGQIGGSGGSKSASDQISCKIMMRGRRE